MLIHCTLKLSRKLPAVAPEPLPIDSPLGSWTANLLVIDRRQCVLACHDQARFPLFLPGLRKEEFQQLGPRCNACSSTVCARQGFRTARSRAPGWRSVPRISTARPTVPCSPR